MKDLLINNWPLVVSILMMVATVVLTARNRAWFVWFNETAWFAYTQAEKQGLLQNWSGKQKLDHYMTIWHDAYLKKFGTTPTPALISQAVAKAQQLSLQDKVQKLVNPPSPSTSS